MAGLSVSTMTKRSMPMPIPAVGGIPLSRAVRKSSSTPHASSSPIAFLSAYVVMVRGVVRMRRMRVKMMVVVVMMKLTIRSMIRMTKGVNADGVGEGEECEYG